MQLAHASSSGDPWPVVRTVGFQAVQADGFTFLLKRRAGLSAALLPVAINYVEGKFMKGDVCEQWRAEGIAEEVPVEVALKTAPAASFAQILAAGARSGGKADAEGRRVRLEDREGFVGETAALKERLALSEITKDELSAAAIVYRVMPVRMELMVGGPDFPMWERFEWKLSVDGSEWAEPTRILPY